MLFPDHKIAYIDECGSFGYDFDKAGTTSHFVVCAVIVEQEMVEPLSSRVQEIRDGEFGGKELKSNSVRGDYKKRFRILKELLDLPFHVIYVVVDKRKIYPESGLSYKQSFIKFTNSLLHKTLKRGYESLLIISDEHGTPEFMLGFEKYVIETGKLFNTYDFRFEDSSQCDLLQLADFVCGTIALGYREEVPKHYWAYLNFLRDKIIYKDIFPREYKNYLVDEGTRPDDFDESIAHWCIRLAESYVEDYENSGNSVESDRIIVVNRLLFQLQINPTGYVQTPVLKRLVKNMTGRSYSTRKFRVDIVGSLRDSGVVISSSTKGYKIPLSLNEVYSYSNHTMQVIYPMLERLGKARNSILLATENELDILDIPEYAEIKAYFDYIKGDGNLTGKTIETEILGGHSESSVRKNVGV